MTAVSPEFRLPLQHAATSGVREADMKGPCFALLSLLLAGANWVSIVAQGHDQSRPPSNLRVDALIQPVVDRMWQVSPTFRRQCRRLAAERNLQVTVSRDDQPTRASFANARTALTFQGDVPLAAQVYLKPSTNTPELIAHELEHILEQLDGVDLKAQVGNGGVWKGDRTFFETRRAIEAGRRVAREMAATQRINHSPKSSTATAGEALVTLKLQDRDATPTSPRTAHVSADGRYVVFISSARLVEDDRNSFRDVYVTDLATGRSTLESVGRDGLAGNGDSYSAEISGDGRYVVFASHAGNLTTPSSSTGTAQIFLRDRTARITRLLTANAAGEPANGSSGQPVISADGTAVAFESAATDLTGIGDASRLQTVGIYRMSLVTGARLRLDTVAGGSSGSSMSPAIDADGRHVVFASKADLTCADAGGCAIETRDRNCVADVYIYDTETGTTSRISRNQIGRDANGASYDPAISGDGRFVAFVSQASNLTRESTGRTPQIYRHDLTSGVTALVSRAPSGRPANASSLRPALSFDGSTITFQSLATNLLCEQLKKCPPQLDDINLLWDIFVVDVRRNRTARMSADGADEWMENSRGPSIDSAGTIVTFGSRHPIDASDAAHDEDLFVVRLRPARLVSRRFPFYLYLGLMFTFT